MKYLNTLESTQADYHRMHSQLMMLIKKFLLMLMLWRRNYVTRRTLDGVSDHLLKDIGLTPNEAKAEARKSFWE
ncbi:DUF1127 domain-containing protein [Vibrio methylphosphonaticus]|uniref:DUF1127 domain-containing protein n=1 Tax=Vibrio methylphosphonaticus TaxID=2946866 RepID=UPI00202A5BA1|nr:DUF1127 domain-containing protein [Vibrio methylphosphonaticus]MCL9773307.1 DUF1127 domain-containing protein [Vibrio methylphosphonaticus]